jgi:hypothetical protein
VPTLFRPSTIEKTWFVHPAPAWTSLIWSCCPTAAWLGSSKLPVTSSLTGLVTASASLPPVIQAHGSGVGLTQLSSGL